MSLDMFLKIDSVSGESVVSGHEEEIQIIECELEMSQSGSMHLGTGGGAGKVNMKDMKIVKYSDKSSPVLMVASCTGRHFPSATVTVRKAGGEPIKVSEFVLENLLVSSVKIAGSTSSVDSEGRPDVKLKEVITLNFESVKQIYTPQGQDGSAAASIEGGFNVAQNVVL